MTMNSNRIDNIVGAVRWIVIGFVVYKIANSTDEIKKFVSGLFSGTGGSEYKESKKEFDERTLYKSGAPIKLLDGARVTLQNIQKAFFDQKQNVFLFQARLYKVQPDGKTAKLAVQGTKVTLEIDGEKETYVQGPLRVQIVVNG